MASRALVALLFVASLSFAYGQVCTKCTDDCPKPHPNVTCNAVSDGQWNIQGDQNIADLAKLACTLAVFGNVVGSSSSTLKMSSCGYLFITGALNPQGSILEVDMQNASVTFTSPAIDLMSYASRASNFSSFSVINVTYPVGGGVPRFTLTGTSMTLRFECNPAANGNCPPAPSPAPPPTPIPTPTPVPIGPPLALGCVDCANGCPKPHPNATCIDFRWVINGSLSPGYAPGLAPFANVSDFTARLACPLYILGDLVADSNKTFQVTRCATINMTGIVKAEGANLDIDMRSYRVSPEEKIPMFFYFAYQVFFTNFNIRNVLTPTGGVDLVPIIEPTQATLYFQCRPDVNCPAVPTFAPSPIQFTPSPLRNQVPQVLACGFLIFVSLLWNLI